MAAIQAQNDAEERLTSRMSETERRLDSVRQFLRSLRQIETIGLGGRSGPLILDGFRRHLRGFLEGGIPGAAPLATEAQQIIDRLQRELDDDPSNAAEQGGGQ